MALRTYVYVDGFSLYYGCLKNTSYKWLDLAKMCNYLLPPDKHVIEKIRYFTAPIVPRPHDPLQRKRQDYYLRALKTLPSVSDTFRAFSFQPSLAHRG